MNPTDEQLDIIALSTTCADTDFVLIEAAAGTGKTTTLKHLVTSRRTYRKGEAMLYLAYNREAVAEAKRSFDFRDANVDIRTVNGLTMRWWKECYLCQPSHSTSTPTASATEEEEEEEEEEEKTKTKAERSNEMKHTSDMSLVDIDTCSSENMFTDQAQLHTDTIVCLLGNRLDSIGNKEETDVAALFAWQTFEKFVLSQDRVPSEKHIDRRYWCKKSKKHYTSAAALPYDEFARHLFSLVQMNHPDMLITFAAVDKLCSLSRHQFSNYKNKKYDWIMVDEAQDWNPAQLSIIMQQDSAMQLFVGDSNQSLYSFRGAAGELQSLKCFATKAYKLKTSFRFGRNIARVANHILWWKSKLLKERQRDTACCDDMMVVGGSNSSNGRVLLYEQWSSVASTHSAPPSISSPLTILCLKNTTLLKQVVDLIKKYGSTTNSFTVTFASSKYQDLDSFIKDAVLQDISLDLLRSCLVHGRDRVDVCAKVLTVHYSKGLEFKRVRISHDLNPLISNKQQKSNWTDYGTTDPVRDLNLWYVAVTRAKEELQLNEHWSRFIEIAKSDESFKQKFGEFN